MLDEGLYTSVSEIGEVEKYLEELREPDFAAGAVGTRHRRRDPRGEDGSDADAGEAGAAAVPDPTSCGRARTASVCAEAIRVEHPTGRSAWRAPTR
jgi:hypothetical protein